MALRCRLQGKLPRVTVPLAEVADFSDTDELVRAERSRAPRLSKSPSHDFFRFWHFEARSRLRRSVYSVYCWGFCPIQFLSCLYIVPLPKILASRLVASLLLALLHHNNGIPPAACFSSQVQELSSVPFRT